MAIAIPTLLFAFYFGLRQRWFLFMLFSLLAITTKENVALTVSMIGIALVPINRNKKTFLVGVTTFFFGIAFSLIAIKSVIPTFSQKGYMYGGWFLEFIERLLHTPILMIPYEIMQNYLFTPDALTYLYLLFRPFGFLSFLGFPLLIISAPELAINLMSDHAEMRSIMMHYDSAALPGIVISAIYGAYFWKIIVKKFSRRVGKYQELLLHAPIFVAFAISIIVFQRSNPTPLSANCFCNVYSVSKQDLLYASELRKIPSNKSITASPEIRPHVSQREKSYTLPAMVDQADYIAIITQNRLVGDYRTKEFELILFRS